MAKDRICYYYLVLQPTGQSIEDELLKTSAMSVNMIALCHRFPPRNISCKVKQFFPTDQLLMVAGYSGATWITLCIFLYSENTTAGKKP